MLPYCFCFIPEHIAGLHHLRLLWWGSQSLSSSSSSAMENNTSWNIIFQQRLLLGYSISLRFTNLSASINTNLLKFSPVWVEFTSSRAHSNMNAGAAYIMICRVFCLGAHSHLCSSHQRLIFLAIEVPSWKALWSQLFMSPCYMPSIILLYLSDILHGILSTKYIYFYICTIKVLKIPHFLQKKKKSRMWRWKKAEEKEVLK